jgi:hypothetical protein
MFSVVKWLLPKRLARIPFSTSKLGSVWHCPLPPA